VYNLNFHKVDVIMNNMISILLRSVARYFNLKSVIFELKYRTNLGK